LALSAITKWGYRRTFWEILKMDEPSMAAIAKMIDHALLHPTLTDSDIGDGCELAQKYDVATVCVKPYAIPLAVECLQGSAVDVCAVIGFPHGNSTIDIKTREAAAAVEAGALEVDMVVNVGKVLGEAWDYLRGEIASVNGAVVAAGGILKVIFENDYLQDRHIETLCEVCSKIGVAFVKTSSGFGFVRQPNGMYSYIGATTHHLELMVTHSANGVQVKASGGIRNLDDLLRMRAIGATRIGTSSTEAIMEEALSRGYKSSSIS
jgi:deoxyribose-phosphate aldolase